MHSTEKLFVVVGLEWLWWILSESKMKPFETKRYLTLSSGMVDIRLWRCKALRSGVVDIGLRGPLRSSVIDVRLWRRKTLRSSVVDVRLWRRKAFRSSVVDIRFWRCKAFGSSMIDIGFTLGSLLSTLLCEPLWRCQQLISRHKFKTYSRHL